MPTYRYRCSSECGEEKVVIHGIKEEPEILCPACGSTMCRAITASSAGVVMKGMTPSKAWKEARYRKKRHAELGVRQIERYGHGPSLIPNIGGEETGTWLEAAKLAEEKGLDSKKFEELAHKEKTGVRSMGVDDSKWKAAKEDKRFF